MPVNTVRTELNFTTNTTTILPFSTLPKPPPSPNPSTFLSYIHSLPQCEQLLLERVQLHTDAFTLASHLSQSEINWIAVSNGSVQHSQASFRWIMSHTSRQCIAHAVGLRTGTNPLRIDLKAMASSPSYDSFLTYQPTRT